MGLHWSPPATASSRRPPSWTSVVQSRSQPQTFVKLKSSAIGYEVTSLSKTRPLCRRLQLQGLPFLTSPFWRASTTTSLSRHSWRRLHSTQSLSKTRLCSYHDAILATGKAAPIHRLVILTTTAPTPKHGSRNKTTKILRTHRD